MTKYHIPTSNNESGYDTCFEISRIKLPKTFFIFFSTYLKSISSLPV